MEGSSIEYTVDELAAAAGLPSRTVRHYQSEGLLPPPRKQGRVALYHHEHLERLGLIARLRDRGLTLKGIRDALGHIEQGHLSLEDWLGIGDQLREPWSREQPGVLSDEEAAQRFADRRPGLRGDLVDAGLLQPRAALPTADIVPSPRLLEIALELEDAGVDVGTAAGAAAIIRKQLRRAADDLVEYFARHAGEGFGRSPTEAVATLERVRPLTTEAVSILFAHEIDRAVREGMDDVRQSLGKRAKRQAKVAPS